MVIWLVGLSGSGKTTLGNKLYKKIKLLEANTVFIDGDVVREIFGSDIDHSLEGRKKNAERISQLCKFLDFSGLNVVAAVLSIFPDWQRWNRINFSVYKQIFLDVSWECLKKRDPKGFYKQIEEGKIENFVGFDIKFPRPVDNDIVINEDMMIKGINSNVKMIYKTIFNGL